MLPARIEPFGVVASIVALTAMQQPILRPPAVPLVVHDPYFSIWSFADKVTDDWPRHWTGAINGMCGMIRINGKPYRWMGLGLRDVPAMAQVGMEVLLTKTVHVFEQDGVRLIVIFCADQLTSSDIESRFVPITTLELRVEPIPSESLDVSVYFDTSAEAAVNTPDQRVVWSRIGDDPAVLQFMCIDGEPLVRAGDNVRIDWGSCVIAAERPWRTGFGTADESRLAFVDSAEPLELLNVPRCANERWPVARFIVETPDRVPLTDWFSTKDAQGRISSTFGRRSGVHAFPNSGMEVTARMSETAQQRDLAFDIVKGVSILEVVAHQTLGISLRLFAEKGTAEWWGLFAFYKTLHFAVPAFLMMSALLLARSLAKQGKPNWTRFYIRRASAARLARVGELARVSTLGQGLLPFVFLYGSCASLARLSSALVLYEADGIVLWLVDARRIFAANDRVLFQFRRRLCQ